MKDNERLIWISTCRFVMICVFVAGGCDLLGGHLLVLGMEIHKETLLCGRTR